MSLRLYMKHAIWDFLLCLAITASLAVTLQAGFNVSESVSMTVLSVVVCAILLGVLFFAGYSKRYLLRAILIYIGVAVVIIAVSAVTSPSGNLLEDSTGNHLIPMLVLIIVAPATFVLTRRPLGTVILFVVGFFMCVFIQFLYLEYHIVADIIFVVTSVAMIAYRNYADSVEHASLVSKASFHSGFLSALGMSAAILGVAALIFFVVIAPLNPQAASIKLIQEYRRLPEIHARDTVTVSDDVDTSLYSSTYDDVIKSTSYMKEGPNGIPVPSTDLVTPDNEDNTENGTYADLDKTSDTQAFDVLTMGTHTFPWLIVIIILLVAALIYGLYRWQIHRRRKWFAGICNSSPHGHITGMYAFFVSRFGKMGIAKAAASTPKEYAEGQGSTIDNFASSNCSIPFKKMTDIFMDTAYGYKEVKTDDVELYDRYYGSFYKNCRAYLGNFGYLKKFFAL